MISRMFTLALLLLLVVPASAAPIVALGPPVANEFSTIDPGSIRVQMLGAGETVDVQLSMTVHPFCFRPITMGLATTGDGGTFTDQTGIVINGCGGDTSEFDIRLTGDGATHVFGIELVDLDAGVPLLSVPVELFPGVADSDGDGIDDLSDNCTVVPNPSQRDTNGDGYGNACDPDLNNDGVVHFVDIALWVPFFSMATSGDADFNGDGVANFLDFALFPQYFLGPPGPSALSQ